MLFYACIERDRSKIKMGLKIEAWAGEMARLLKVRLTMKIKEKLKLMWWRKPLSPALAREREESFVFKARSM